MLPSCMILKFHPRPFAFPRLTRHIPNARSSPLSPVLRSLRLLAAPPSLCGCPVFHLPYTLPSSVSRNSFACHSYENTWGAGAFFPSWTSPTFQRSYDPIFPTVSHTSTSQCSLPTAHYFS